MLREAVDERADAGGSREHCTPRLEREIGRNDGARALVTTTDDAVEKVAGASVARQISKLIEDQNVGSRIPFHAPLDRRKGLLLQEVCERGVDGGEADGLSFFERALSEVLGEGALADAARPAKQNVVPEYRKNKALAPGTKGTQSHTLGCEDSRRRTFRGSVRGRRSVVAASVVLVRSVGDAVDAPLRSAG